MFLFSCSKQIRCFMSVLSNSFFCIPASAEARQARAAAVAGQSDPNTVTPATATYAGNVNTACGL